MKAGLAKVCWTFALMLVCAMSVADASARCAGPRERLDEEGRVIERIWPGGRLLQYTWDTAIERIVRVDGRTEKNGIVWTHCFTYDATGALKVEYDCLGNQHALDARASIDMERGTAMRKHRHGGGR